MVITDQTTAEPRTTESNGVDVESRSRALAERYRQVRDRTERLAAPLSPEDQMVQSMDDVSPTKWHRAHTTWFFAEFVLGADGSSDRAWDLPEYRFLYNSYYEAVGARHPRPNRGLVTRPSLSEIAAYRASVDAEMEALFDSLKGRPLDATLLDTIELGTHHEEQHQELLLIDIKHVLSMNPAVGPAYHDVDVPAATDPGPAAFIEFTGGIMEIGRDPGSGFTFDNEGPRHEVRLYDFALADRLVTTGEWQAFIDDGGYQRPEFWKSDGWYRAQSEGWSAPLYWRRHPDDPSTWWIHTLTGLRTVDPHEPVGHVSHYEADAYASWAGARLPTEFEWECAAARHLAEHGDSFHGGSSHVDVRPDRAVHGDGALDESSTSTFHPRSAGTPTGGLRQLFGGCWEWTSSAYEPYPGFTVAPGAIGEYNGKFMSGQQVLRGGGALTPAGHTRLTYRNFFHPHTRWHLGGVRLAADREHPAAHRR
jgi:ergothioneine biosynthesis protein EgtB